MKKVFQLKAPGRADARVVEAVKHDVRRYVQRERRKPLPDGFSEWQFHCQAGSSAAAATARELGQLTAAIDEVAQAGGSEIYIEVVAQAGHRTPSSTKATPPLA